MQSMETSYDSNGFIPSAFDYNFDASVGSGRNASGAAQSSSSASPIAQHISLLPSDSFENGLALDLDDGMPGQDRRSDSVDKEPLTPAQSRRKAQNRAAYVFKNSLLMRLKLTSVLTDRGPSANAKSDMSEISRRNSTSSLPQHHHYNPTTSA